MKSWKIKGLLLIWWFKLQLVFLCEMADSCVHLHTAVKKWGTQANATWLRQTHEKRADRRSQWRDDTEYYESDRNQYVFCLIHLAALREAHRKSKTWLKTASRWQTCFSFIHCTHAYSCDYSHPVVYPLPCGEGMWLWRRMGAFPFKLIRLLFTWITLPTWYYSILVVLQVCFFLSLL